MTTRDASAATGLLVVEGQNDQHLVLHLCRQAEPELVNGFDFHDAQGITSVINSVRNFVIQPGLTGVGFVLDGDETPREHWRQVIDRIAVAYPDMRLPPAPEPNGTIVPEDSDMGSPRIGIWVMPDNQTAGELEDFVVQMIPAGDLVWPRSQDYIEGIPATARKFEDNKITKSQVHAWLAARRFPGLMGVAVRDGDLNVSGPLSQTFLAWLNRLFG